MARKQKPGNNNGNDSSLIDDRGNPLPKRVPLLTRLQSISAKAKVIIVSLLVLATATATLITNIEKISEFFRSDPPPITVPLIIVKLSNTAEEEVRVATRCDFFLWLPGSDARHTIGKYEFRTMSNSPLDSGIITIKPDTTVTVLAQILNQELYGRVLNQKDCDISLHVCRSNRGITITRSLPFTKEAIDRYYIPVDVGTN